MRLSPKAITIPGAYSGTNPGGADLTDDRRTRLMTLAKAILENMEDHQLFGFILNHAGKKAVPEIVKIWGGGESPTGDDLVELVLEN